MLVWLSLFAGVLVAFLLWNLRGRFGSHRITQLNEKRRAASRLVGRGEFVDGNRHLAVALALTQSTLFYENADMQASIDLQWVREIEYDTELGTGAMVEGGKVLRLRSPSQAFEFVLPNDVVARWHVELPPRRPFIAAAITVSELVVPVAATAASR